MENLGWYNFNNLSAYTGNVKSTLKGRGGLNKNDIYNLYFNGKHAKILKVI